MHSRLKKKVHTKLRSIYLSHKGIVFLIIRQEISGWCKDLDGTPNVPSPLSLAGADTAGPVRVGRRMRDVQCSEADRAAKY